MKEPQKEETNTFFNVIAIIGAVLIFIGFAWLIAKNWHQIPDVLKILILASATFGAFISGVILREHESEASGRALIVLGALLYILSVFLIAQIYSTSTTIQGVAWLILLCWPVIMLTAYLLDSQENLLISLVVFFIWLSTQYTASIMHSGFGEAPVIGFILIFLSAGLLLCGLTSLHKSINHKFTSIYRFWTVFYFLAIFYILSFQTMLPMLSEYAFSGETISIFLISFLVISLLAFMIMTLFATDKGAISFVEIATFIGIVALIFILVLSTKIGAGLVGYCYPTSCYDFRTSSECNSVPAPLSCEWEQESCREIGCYNFVTEEKCNSTLDKIDCYWRADNMNPPNGYCDVDFQGQKDPMTDLYAECSEFNNQKEQCAQETMCKWQPSFNPMEKLPTSLWLIWIVNNIVFMGFIILILWYGQQIGSTKIVNLGLAVFVLDVITRYIGFWMDLSGYFAFSLLAILGGVILIVGAWVIPRWRKKLLEETAKEESSVVKSNPKSQR